MLEEDLEMNRETIRNILVEVLWKWKIFARFFPYSLTDKRKAFRLQTCKEFIQSEDEDRS